MNDIILYHGATTIVDNPLTHVGRPELDFGPGFYVTKDKEQAEKWAKTKAGRKKDAKPMLNIYKFKLNEFSLDPQYNKIIFSEYNIEWLDFVASSRKGNKQWQNYDWIEGGIANDSVISTVDAYVDGFITAEQALDKLISEELRQQVCISNQNIIDKYMQFVECIKL